VVKALRYKSEGRWFETRWLFFSIYVIFTAVLGPGVYSVSDRKIMFLGSRGHYATNRKVAGSIPDEMIFKFI
jgi:hypothetical protein